jgi:MFS transporter, ACS family, glucarate transporter
MTRPTRVRYSIVLLALLVNMMCYTDRVCIAVAGPEIQKAFAFTPAQMGLVFSIFSLSYFLGQAPWGTLADRFGARWIVAGAILGWSAFTAFTGLAWSFASLLVIRFVFGLLEAALSPSVAAAFGRWTLVTERATAFGAYLGGGRLGGALTPALALLLMAAYGWRAMFVIFGVAGLFWCAAWLFWYRDNPAEHPKVNAREAELLAAAAPEAASGERAAVDWRAILGSGRLWCLLGAAFGSTFMWQFYITWFPTYLKEYRGLSLAEVSFYAGLPFLAGVGANWLGGLATDALGRRYHPRYARTLVGLISLTAGALLMSAGIWLSLPQPAALAMGLAAGAVDLYLGAAWSSAVDIGGKAGGAVAGMMNAASNCAGFASPALMGWVLGATGNWDIVLTLSAGTTLVAAVLWLGVNPGGTSRRAPVAEAAV